MEEPLERCPVHNVFHPKGPTCDPTQHDTANPWVEAVIESLDPEFTGDGREDHYVNISELTKNPQIPVKFNEEVVGTAWVGADGVITAQIYAETGRKFSTYLKDGFLDSISIDGSIKRPEPSRYNYDPRGAHSTHCSRKSHLHGPLCSGDCPTCHGK